MADAEQGAPPPQENPYVQRLATEDVPCLRCGYNLRGLSPERQCPECGAAVMRSLQGNLLAFSSPDYLRKLHFGVIFILIAVVAGILGLVLLIAAAVLGEVFGATVAVMTTLEFIMVFGAFALALLSLTGWWLFSSPDPAFVGYDTNDRPRLVLRIAIVVIAVTTFSETVIEFTPMQQDLYEVLDVLGGLASFVASITQFFASLLYINRLAPRLPSERIGQKAMQYKWLLPLIFIAGMCVLIGPLVAMLMYFLLINDVRSHLKTVRAQQADPDASFVPIGAQSQI